MKSSPVYCIVNAEGRKSQPSFGSQGFDQEIRVGTSSSNSHVFGNISVERHYDSELDTTVFIMFLDGKVIKKGHLKGRDFEMIQG